DGAGGSEDGYSLHGWKKLSTTLCPPRPPWWRVSNIFQHQIVNGRREQQRIDPIEHPAVTGNQSRAVFYARAALQHRLEKISRNPERDDDDSEQRAQSHRDRRQPPRARHGHGRGAEQDPTEGALDGLLRADRPGQTS